MSLSVSFCLMILYLTGWGINVWYINLHGVSPTNEKKIALCYDGRCDSLAPHRPAPPFPTPLHRPFLRVCLFFGYTDHPAPASFFKAHPAVQNNKRNAPCATVQNVASGIATFPATSRVAVGYVVPIGCSRKGLLLLLLLEGLLLMLLQGCCCNCFSTWSMFSLATPPRPPNPTPSPFLKKNPASTQSRVIVAAASAPWLMFSLAASSYGAGHKCVVH